MSPPLSQLSSYLPVILFAGIFFLIYRHNARKASKNFDWYRRQYPHCVRDGCVKCNKCGSGHMGTERLMNHSYLRGHICRQCGTTLYYSREGG